MSYEVAVSALPDCDLHKLAGERVQAEYDGATVYGSWAYMCHEHMVSHGVGLGTGRGQRLVLRGEATRTPAWDLDRDFGPERAAKVREYLASPEGAQYLNYANGDETYASWLAVVDATMQSMVGVTHRDIADWHWRDAFDGGQRPREAARDALAEDDTFGMLMGGSE